MIDKLFNLNYAIFTHHFESHEFIKESIKKSIPPKLIVTLPIELNYKWLGHELFDIRKFAKENNLLILECKNFNEVEVQNFLKKFNINLLIILGCSQIIKKELIDIPKFGAIGSHASLLPDLRGPAPVNWALIKDLKQTGNSLMKLSNILDAGEIIDQTIIEITDSDNCETLYQKIAETNSLMILKVLFYILENQRLPTSKKQNFLNNLSPKRRPEDSKIRWELNSREIFNFIRGLSYPYPNAFCYLKRDIIEINSCSYLITNHSYKAGCIVGEFKKDKIVSKKIVIATTDGLLLISKLKLNSVQLENDDLVEWAKMNNGNILI